MTGPWPLLLIGLLEVSGEPRIGLRTTAEVLGTTFSASAGIGYQAIRAGLAVLPSIDGGGAKVEAGQ